MLDSATRCRCRSPWRSRRARSARRRWSSPARRPAARPARPRAPPRRSTTGLVKNEPALQVSWSAGSSTMPLPRRRSRTASRTSASGARSPELDAEGAGELGVLDRRAERRPDGSWKVTVEDDVPARVGLEARGPVAEAAVGVGEGAHARAACGPRPAPRRWSGRPPGRRRRRSGSASRRPEPGMPASASIPTQPRSTARATRSSQLSPAATLTSTPPHDGSSRSASGTTPRGRDLDDACRRSRSSATTRLLPAAEDQHRLTGRVGLDGRVDQLGLGGRARPTARRGPPSRSVVWSPAAASCWQARMTALGMPSTFCPSQVTVRATVVSPSSALLGLAGDLDVDAALGRDDDRVGELAAEADHLGAREPARRPRERPAPSCTSRARSRPAVRRCAATSSSWWIGLWSPLAAA